MIIDKISNASAYLGLVRNLDNAIKFINNNYHLPVGRHEFEGGAIISSQIISSHLDEKEFESHKIFADVMFVLEGEEMMSYCPVDELIVSKEHDIAADCGFYVGEGKDILVKIPEGYFYIALPNEGHKPCVHTDTEISTRKYVIKCSQQ